MAISHYRILKKIGHGQFGQVYCGSDRTTGELVALKRLDTRRSPTQRFLNELAILSKLHHPNIVQIQGLAYEAKERYLVTNYCQGGTLRHLMTPKIRPTLVQKLHIIRDVLLGLEHMHHHKVIHCDLKPENILLNVSTQGWSAQIADFGVAHWQDQSDKLDQRLGDTGSPAYMAPERFYGHYSPASDTYAVGVMLYELILGKRPFTGMPGEIMKAHFHQRVKVPKSLPIQLKLILKTALQKLPQHRFASAQQMRFALEGVIAVLERGHGDDNTQTVLQGESAQTDRVSVQGETLGDRVAARPAIPLDVSQLTLVSSMEVPVQQLWAAANACLGLIQSNHQQHIVRWSGTEGSTSVVWEQSGIGSPNAMLDISPEGTWCATVQSRFSTEPDQSPPAAWLQTVALQSGRVQQPSPIAASPDQLWMINSRHLLTTSMVQGEEERACRSLQLWNRRGQVYWSHEIPFAIRNAAKSLVTEDRVFAIVDNPTPAGVWIDLNPFHIQRFSLPHAADWVCAATWGYVVVNRSGAIACLNRRARTIAKLALDLPTQVRVQAVALVNSNILWIAIEQQQGNQILTLNLSPYLPKRMVSLEEG